MKLYINKNAVFGKCKLEIYVCYIFIFRLVKDYIKHVKIWKINILQLNSKCSIGPSKHEVNLFKVCKKRKN